MPAAFAGPLEFGLTRLAVFPHFDLLCQSMRFLHILHA